jgi:hypothetical protein
MYIEDAFNDIRDEQYVSLNVKDCQIILSALVKFADSIMSERTLDEVCLVSFE